MEPGVCQWRSSKTRWTRDDSQLRKVRKLGDNGLDIRKVQKSPRCIRCSTGGIYAGWDGERGTAKLHAGAAVHDDEGEEGEEIKLQKEVSSQRGDKGFKKSQSLASNKSNCRSFRANFMQSNLRGSHSRNETLQNIIGPGRS